MAWQAADSDQGREAVQVGYRLADQVGDGRGFLRRAGHEPEEARAQLVERVDQPLREIRVRPRRARANGEDEEGR